MKTLTRAAMARRLGLSTNTLANYLGKGYIRATLRSPTGRWLFSEADANAIVARFRTYASTGTWPD